MTFNSKATQFYMQTYWDARKESSRSVAERFGSYLNNLSRIDEILSHWLIGKRFVPYRGAGQDLEGVIAKDVVRSDDGEVIDRGGYSVLASSRDKRQVFGIYGHAGAGYEYPMWNNRLDFVTAAGSEPNLSVVTYKLFKAATSATIACWEPTICAVRSNKLRQDFDNEGWFTKAWLTYVPADHAASVDLSGIPLAERTPDGGLLLSATTDVFNPDIPEHIEAARQISLATQHLNAMFPEIRKGSAAARKP